MPNQDPNWPHADAPAETGPDYVALVIEWDDVSDEQISIEPERSARVAATGKPVRSIALAAGAIAAFLVARWGFHRLRHA